MKTMKSWTLGLLTFVMCMGLAACSSNDDPSEEEQTQEELDGMVELLHLKQNLCRLNEKGEPVEAYFGKPYNASNPSERVYYTRSISSAKSRFMLLFASSTPCSADGNTYPLHNKQGSATFAEGNGKNGLLATATFNVPGLKGLVTKIYFIDVNEKGDNGFDTNSLTPGTLVYYQDKWDPAYMITLGRWSDRSGESDILLMAPYIIRYTKPTSWRELTVSNIEDSTGLIDVVEKYSEKEYADFCNNLLLLLSTEKWMNGDGYETTSDFVTHTYTQWDGKSFFVQASETWNIDQLGPQNKYLLFSPNNYADRTKLYTMKNNQLPDALKKAIPVASLIGEAQQFELKYLTK